MAYLIFMLGAAIGFVAGVFITRLTGAQNPTEIDFGGRDE